MLIIGKTCTICKNYEPDETKLGTRLTKGKMSILSRHLTCIELLKAKGKENTKAKLKLKLEEAKAETKKRKAKKLIEQMLFGKVCPKCDEKKPIDQYYKTTKATSYCKKCHRATVRKAIEANPIATAEYQKKYHAVWIENNRENRKAYMKEWNKNKREGNLKLQIS